MMRNTGTALAAVALLALGGCFDRRDSDDNVANVAVQAPGDMVPDDGFNAASPLGNATMNAADAGDNLANAAANTANATGNVLEE